MATATKAKKAPKAPKAPKVSTGGMKGTKGKTVVVKSLSNLAAIALSKFPTPKAARKGMTVGEHTVDETIRIVGTVKVGEDYEQTVSQSIQWQKLALAAMSRLNSDVVESLVRRINEDLPQEAADLSERINKIWGEISESAKQTVQGKVTAKLSFTKA